nr:MAG TPA: hypothetical protein [Caudoviricetes sp.]
MLRRCGVGESAYVWVHAPVFLSSGSQCFGVWFWSLFCVC